MGAAKGIEENSFSQYEKISDSVLDSADVDGSNKYADLLEQQARELALIHANRIKADQTRLKFFYRISVTILVLTFFMTLWVLWILIDRDKMESTVAVAFFGSVTAQVIGLAHIIAKYFFPEGGGLTKDPNMDN